jgi:hypothetical protein
VIVRSPFATLRRQGYQGRSPWLVSSQAGYRSVPPCRHAKWGRLTSVGQTISTALRRGAHCPPLLPPNRLSHGQRIRRTIARTGLKTAPRWWSVAIGRMKASLQTFAMETSQMSRGTGRIERAIETAFLHEPNRTFTLDELVSIAYPGLKRPEKRHHVAILRGAHNVAARLGWHCWPSERPGHHMVFVNVCNVRSYAIGRLQIDFRHYNDQLYKLERLLDDPEVHNSKWHLVQPGGLWFEYVQTFTAEHAARAAGDDGRANQIARDRAELTRQHRRASGV